MARQPALQKFGLIGQSETFQTMRKMIDKIAAFDIGVLITGETGSGKELAARAIHLQGKRADKPFIPINCGAPPEGPRTIVDRLVKTKNFALRTI